MTCIRKKEADKKDNCTMIRIPDELWGKIRVILPKEKPSKTVGRPTVPFRKVLDGILYILRTDASGSVPDYGSGSTCHRRFHEWVQLDVFRKTWIRPLKTYDNLIGIRWTWQSPDSISIKSPLGGR